MSILVKTFVATCTMVFSFFTIVFPQDATSSLHINVVDQRGDLIKVYFASLKNGETLINQNVEVNTNNPVFKGLTPGNYTLEIKAKGFEPKSLQVQITSKNEQITVILEVAETVENVNVELDVQAAATEEAFSNTLTPKEIAELPEDPDEMRKALKQLAGGGDVVIRVDGFSGADLPAKSQIASIRIVRSSYDAENHSLGYVYVDIVTKVGSRRFSGSASLIFNDETLNARNPFAEKRFPEQSTNAYFFLSGPVVKNRTDFFLTYADKRNLQAQNIVAFLPDGEINDSVSSKTNGKYLNLTINHNLTKNLPIKITYRFLNLDSRNLGVGGFNLSERAYDSKKSSHELRFSTSTYFFQKYLNEFRLQYKNDLLQTIPQSNEPAVNVLDAFSIGGSGNLQKSTDQSLRVFDSLIFGFRQHAIKVGAEVFIEKMNQVSAINENGTFTFSTLQDFMSGTPSMFTQSPQMRDAEVVQYQIAAFVQDDVQIRKNFIASFGMRYEMQNNLDDHNNFSPRIAFSWTPFKNGMTTLRGGIGLFYNWLEPSDLLMIKSQDKTQPSEVVIFDPSFPDPFVAGTEQVLPSSFRQKADDLTNPYVFHTSLGVQHRFSSKANIRGEYVYQKGIHQFRSRNINAPSNGVSPNPDFGKIVHVESSAFFVRNSLDIGFYGKVNKGLDYSFGYTLSKVISDNNGIMGLPSDNYDLRNDISVANTDQRHRFNAYWGWQIMRGMHLGATYFVNSGLPYTITTGRDDNFDAVFNDRPIGVSRNSKRSAWQNQLDLNLSYIFSFVDRKGGSTDGFSVVTGKTEGEPGVTDATKRFSLRFFANAQNVLNHTNLTNFVGVETSPFFGKATSAEQSRKSTFGIRFNF
ncbi:MAG: hypothetical protein ACK5NT_08940 [Pyrinomonadaceae bacterium]